MYSSVGGSPMAYPTTIPVVSDMLHCQIPIELGGDFLDEIVGVWWAFSVGIVAQNLLIGLNPSRHKKNINKEISITSIASITTIIA